MEDINLAMKQGLKLELVSYTGHSRPFFSLCKNMKVAIGESKTKHPIFEVEVRDDDLILS